MLKRLGSRNGGSIYFLPVLSAMIVAALLTLSLGWVIDRVPGWIGEAAFFPWALPALIIAIAVSVAVVLGRLSLRQRVMRCLSKPE